MHPPPCQENLQRRLVASFAKRLDALITARDRLAWAVRVRWLVIGGFFGLAVLAHRFGLFASIQPCVHAAVAGAVMNAANAWCVARGRWVFGVTAIALPLDHVLITYVVMNTGGVQSPFVMMYVVQVLATAMLVDTLVAAASAMLGMLIWVVAMSLQLSGVLALPPLSSAAAPASSAVYTGTWAAYLLYCLVLLVYLGGYIAERLRTSERDVAEKNRELHATLASLQNAHDELRASYRRLTQTEAQLVQSEKMRGLGQLVAGVAHELNNPISFISANVEHVRTYVDRLRRLLEAYRTAEMPPAERIRLDSIRCGLRAEEALADLPSLLDDCEEGARRTKRIVAELRAFSRSDERDSPRPFDVHRGIDNTLALLAHRFKDRIAVHRDFGDVPAVECRPDQLNQVFMNLLANAADAIGSRQGNIWVSIRSGYTGALPVASRRAVVVTIRDDGEGMPESVRARIFEPFFTTKEVGQGTGLGLSVSYGIVERHGGSLLVDSQPGCGATFTLTVPLSQD
jgi:signal transduction histidine kinase